MHHILFQYFQEKTGINEGQFQEFSPFFQLKQLRKNEFLLMEKEICRSIYFVNQGCLRIYSIDTEGQEHTRYFAFERKFASALTSFIQKSPSFEFIQATENTEVLVINYDPFFRLVEHNSAVNKVYRNILENAYITSQERIYNFLEKNALEKLHWLLEYQPDIFSRLSNQMIASYLGITPYTLSRLKAAL